MMSQSAYYWASTENNRRNAWLAYSYGGNAYGDGKYRSFTVRAAVAFTFNL